MTIDTFQSAEWPTASVSRAPFGVLSSGDAVHVFTLTNSRGVEVRVLDYGGLVVSIKTPDRAGVRGDIVLGFNQLLDYETNAPYLGALVGRYANRIARGRFTLDGASYALAVNNGRHALHGGVIGFNRVLWRAEPIHDARGVGVVLAYTSNDGDEGYPGTLAVRVTYMLNELSEFSIDYHAITDKATPVNLTQHGYFDLSAGRAEDVLRHEIAINADTFAPVDHTLIPTGVFQPVEGTPFDLRTSVAIGARINDAHEQLTFGDGFDHSFVIARTAPGLVHAAHVIDPLSGRTLSVATTEPAIHFYSGNALDGTTAGNAGRVHHRRSAFCLETQHFADSPNQPSFPSTILRPGEEFTSRTVYRFGVAPT